MVMVPIDELLAGARANSRLDERPQVTLSYAQSLDGSITTRRGSPLSLSSPESMTVTHRLRAVHDMILVGIGTVLVDNPRLTVRLVKGSNPQPIILDSHLRLPSEANLLHNPGLSPWIATTEDAHTEREAALEANGAKIFRFPANNQGRVPLPDLLAHLANSGIKSLMVEGGASVITAFLSQGLVDFVFLTITPFLVGGLRAPENRIIPPVRLLEVGYESAGDDLIVWGKPFWPSNILE